MKMSVGLKKKHSGFWNVNNERRKKGRLREIPIPRRRTDKVNYGNLFEVDGKTAIFGKTNDTRCV